MTQSNEQASFTPSAGKCSCGEIRYNLQTAPLIIHGCHCSWCQRESGSAFAVNAMIEASAITLTQGTPEYIDTPTNSGKVQRVARCPNCKVAVWSHYAAAGTTLSFVRVGTLENCSDFEPDIHIYTSTKIPWVILPTDKPAFPEFYNIPEQWPAQSLARLKALQAGQQSQQ